jgi:hypothetical protein
MVASPAASASAVVIVALDVAGYSARMEANEARWTAEVAFGKIVVRACAKAD